MRRSIALIVLIVLARPEMRARAQVPTPAVTIEDGYQPPPGLGWRKVASPHFDVIHPAGLEAEAQRVARTLELLRTPLGTTMTPPRRLTVVLQNESVLSNAYAALGPRRAVWITTPPSSGGLLGTGDWLTLLATHETRHVAQTDRTDVGDAHVARVLFGDLGWTLLPHLALPGWMWEGDAVVTESAMSRTGRGRLPEFTQEIRALALAGKLPGYYEAMLGSYNDFFPNRYPLGYMLTSYLRRHYGDTAVAGLFRDAAAHSINPLAFSRAMRRSTHLTPPALYERAMQEAESTWRAQVAGLTLTESVRRSPQPTVHTDFLSPQWLADGSIVALRRGFADLPEVVRITGSNVVRLASASTYDGIRAGGGLVAWTEIVTDTRWGWHEHADIRLLDAVAGAVRTLARGRFGLPAPSPDGARVAAVEIAPAAGSTIVILDAKSGTRLDSIPMPNHELAMSLAWRDDGLALAFTRQGVSGKALTVVELATHEMRDLIPFGTEDVTDPAWGRGFIYFTSPMTGTDAVHAIDPATGRRAQVTSTKIGAGSPAVSVDGQRLLFSEYTLDGTAVYETAIDTSRWQVAVPAPADAALEELVRQEKYMLDAGAVAADTTVFPVRRLGFRDRYNVHSWSLAGALTQGEIGVSLVSGDVLNTLASQLRYVYSTRERASGVEANVAYAGLFPIVDVGGRYGSRSTSYDNGTAIERVTWNESAMNLGLRVPLNFTRGIWQRSLNLGVQGSATRVSDLAVPAARSPGNGTFIPLTAGATFSAREARAYRDLAPRLGLSLAGQWRGTPVGGDFHPRKTLATSTVYLPAPWRHHMLRLTGGYEDHHVDKGISFSSALDAPRGYSYRFASEMTVASIDYELPIAYPDKAFGPFVYIPRVTMGGFADYSTRAGPGFTQTRNSAGAGIAVDLVPFGWKFLEMSLGTRAVYRAQDRKWVVEMFGGLR